MEGGCMLGSGIIILLLLIIISGVVGLMLDKIFSTIFVYVKNHLNNEGRL
jgi:hypothetical protein